MEAPVTNDDPALLALLGEALELILGRRESDLSFARRPLTTITQVLDDRMLHPNDPPENTATVLARVLAGPLEEIITNPNRRLYRTRRLLPIHKVRQQDTRCLQWLARQPGRSARDKVSARNRLLAVARNTGPSRLEHSFALTLCLHLEPKIRHYLGEVRNHKEMSDSGRVRFQAVLRLATAIDSFRSFAKEHDIKELRSQPRPNNVLLHERRYRRVWTGARWLAEEEPRRELLRAHSASAWQELIALIAAAALSNLDILPVDLGFAGTDLGSLQETAGPRVLGLWFQASPGLFRKLRIELHASGNVVVWMLEAGPKGNHTKQFLIAAGSHPAAHWTITKETILRGQWSALCDERELLTEALAEWAGLARRDGPATLPRPEVPPVGLLRITQSDVSFQAGTTLCQVPACAFVLLSALHTRNALPFLLAGHDASRFQIFRTCADPDFPSEDMRERGRPGSWIVPGRFFRSCLSSEPLLAQARREIFAVAQHGSARRLVAARPHRLSFAAQSRFFETLPGSADRKWMIPQPVAIALAWMEQNPGVAKEGSWFGFLDLDSEFPDFALLQAKRLPPRSDQMGWLRYPALRRNQPPSFHWANRAATECLRRSGIPITGALVSSVLAQLNPRSMLGIAAQPGATRGVWVRRRSGWSQLTLNTDDVQRALQAWISQVVAHVSSELIGRASFTPQRIIVSGTTSSARPSRPRPTSLRASAFPPPRSSSPGANTIFATRAGVIAEWQQALRDDPRIWQEIRQRYSQVVGSTAAMAAPPGSASETEWYDYVIVDEAGRSDLFDLLAPMTLGRRILLVGDQQQLPPFIEDTLLARRNEPDADRIRQFQEKLISQTLFRELYDRLPEENRAMLDVQYRMHPVIGDAISDAFYVGELSSGPDDRSADSYQRWLQARQPVWGLFDNHALVWLDSGAGDPPLSTVQNDREIELVKDLVRRALAATPPASHQIPQPFIGVSGAAPASNTSISANLILARAIAEFVTTARVICAIARTHPVESAYRRRLRGLPGLTHEEHAIIRVSGPIEPLPAYFVDNVITTGTTVAACRRALGWGVGLAYADASTCYNSSLHRRT
jgi:hypothetical protein